MKLCRLRVTDFAGIAHADIELGPGLNVLYGPNDLGKSTLADAIRVALLLPHTSSHGEQYLPWTGGGRPVVELTFQTEAQRIWRVKKQFGKSGFSLLEESRDNVTFNEVEKGRRVDARLRELLRWGIPEPGGAGGAKGLPDSFLATVLLSTQADVAAVLRQSLEEDPTGSGKERIAAALQAVAQDPLFLSLLRRTQERRDEAYTEKGMKKGSKDSPFRKAADRVRQLREEQERWQQAVDDSEGVERELRELANKRTRLEERVSGETDRLTTIERLARETAALHVADDQVQQAAQQVGRIQQIERDIAAAGQSVQQLAERRTAAEEAARVAQEGLAQANARLDGAQRALESLSAAGAGSDTVERQSLEIRLAAAEKAAGDAGRRIEQADAALKKVDESRAAEAEHQRLSEELRRLAELLSGATAQEKGAQSDVQQLDLLECALALRNAQTHLEVSDGAVQRASVVRSRADALSTALQTLEDRRSRLDLPSPDVVSAMRRLENDLAAARGAVNVGLVVTVNPLRPLDLRVSKDGSATEEIAAEQPLELEANTSVDLEIRGVASVELRGGRREAQEILRALEQRWATEFAPPLSAAGAADLNELDGRLAEARTLESEIATTKTELATLQEQLAASPGAEGAQRAAVERLRTCRAALGKASPEPLLKEVAALGVDPAVALRKRKERSAKALEMARAKAVEAQTAHGVGEERLRNSTSRLDAANTVRAAALGEFPGGLPEAHAAAHAALTSFDAERSRVKQEIETIAQRLEWERRRADAALAAARVVADKARKAAEAGQKTLTEAISAHSIQVGRLAELRRARAAEDLAAAEEALKAATERRAGLPVPEQVVSEEKIAAGRTSAERAKAELAAVEREVQRAHGALEQVGGGVARDRLQDAMEAYDLAERQEREVEADCEAWRLLLDQMKLADAEQASNLGQVLGPAVATRFEALTNQRYEGVRIAADLGTEGVVVRGAVRSTERVSVGTREQLSTLYRLSLAEYLGSTVVLDDQLVQSDELRMGWFRALLRDKASQFQIVVFTCRPDDYLTGEGDLTSPGPHSRKSTAGPVRVVDLGSAIQRA